jgi:ribonucleoside-triphosphate reductase
MNLAKQSLETKRNVVQHYINRGLFPYTKRYLKTLDNHFSTIGVNGLNEMIRNYSARTGEEFDISDSRGEKLALDLLDHIRARMVEFQESTGHMYNLEATPAEGTTYRFAKEDAARYEDILQAGTKEKPYYTNSSQLPVGYTTDPFEALAKQEALQSKYTGGTVLHLYMGERISSSAACKELVKRALSNYRLPYVTVTPTFSISPINGYIAGEHFFDPIYDAEHNLDETSPEAKRVRCEVWTRVMGYFRPVSSFNIGKQGEFYERVSFVEPSEIKAFSAAGGVGAGVAGAGLAGVAAGVGAASVGGDAGIASADLGAASSIASSANSSTADSQSEKSSFSYAE